MKEKIYFSIDLKSFFASCECVNAGLDPFKEAIVVANPHQGNGAITLAITPYLKSKNVSSRCRLYEIPKSINYKIVSPNMDLYKEYSKKVVDVYLEFVDKKDLHVYSIDECFLDVTNYFSLYKLDEVSLAKTILARVYEKTGLRATVGIGNTIFLAKVAMDTEAKKSSDFIAYWKSCDIENKLWNIKKLSDIWKIGPSLEKKLSNMGIYTANDLANTKKDILKIKLGVIGANLYDNFHAVETDSIKSLNEAPKSKSFSHSKYLLKDYEYKNTLPLVLQMCETLDTRLKCENKLCQRINFKYTFIDNKNITNKTINLLNPTNNGEVLYSEIIKSLDETLITSLIRKIDINLMKITDKKEVQLSLFNDNTTIKNTDNITDVMYQIKEKYGKKSITKASTLLDNND